jgi:single-strand DNA-binding protein
MHRMTIIGRLGQDPEMRYTPAGVAVTSFSVASENKKGDATEWIRVSVFNKQAELANEFLAKGRQVYVEGPFQLRSYTSKDGLIKQSLEMVANTIQFLTPSAGQAVSGGTVVEESDELPF